MSNLIRMRSFFFHYNKPATQKNKKVTISLHYKNICYLVDNIICNVPTEGRIRKASPQFVMIGKANKVEFKENMAIIN